MKMLVALGASCHEGKPLICADYVTLISADQRPEGSEDQRLFLEAHSARLSDANVL